MSELFCVILDLLIYKILETVEKMCHGALFRFNPQF